VRLAAATAAVVLVSNTLPHDPLAVLRGVVDLLPDAAVAHAPLVATAALLSLAAAAAIAAAALRYRVPSRPPPSEPGGHERGRKALPSTHRHEAGLVRLGA
jgi:hypothetical protein